MNKSTNLQNNQTTKVKYALYTFKYSRKNNIITYCITENMHAHCSILKLHDRCEYIITKFND